MLDSVGTSAGGRPFLPLLFAGDINVYSMARAFHEAYGIRSKAYGKYAAGPCLYSRIIDYHPLADIDQDQVFLSLVEEEARAHPGVQLLLVACGDSYAELVSRHRDAFPPNVIAPVAPFQLVERLTHKEQFYESCREAGLDYPQTHILRKSEQESRLPFPGPYILKPSAGTAYWAHPFEGQQKIYKAAEEEEVWRIADAIFASGYDDSLVVQHFIPGGDHCMRVLTGYADRKGRVTMMCLGHVLLEEHTPKGSGNHAVILTECQRPLMESLGNFLSDQGYVGLFNFDIKYDERDGGYKVLELNARQGRSNYYVTASGANLAACLVEDRVDEMDLPLRLVDTDLLWMMVPQKVAFDYVEPAACRARMKQLMEAGRKVHPLFYEADRGLRRRVRLLKHQLGHFVKYRKYMVKP